MTFKELSDEANRLGYVLVPVTDFFRTVSIEELKAEAKRQGYNLTKIQPNLGKLKNCKCGCKQECNDKITVTPVHKIGLRAQTRWIPVSERLPEKDMACLVAVGKFNLTHIAMYSDLMGMIDHRIFYRGDIGHDNFENITQYVTAWIPLPKSYKPQESEDN